jgi:branched-chain amino acid aminotransferase
MGAGSYHRIGRLDLRGTRWYGESEPSGIVSHPLPVKHLVSMAEIINVNGALAPADRAAIPVLDHGFLYGDAVYETIRTYDGEPFLLPRHLERLEASCRRIRIAMPPAPDIEREVRRTISEAANDESYIRIMVTRGVGPIGYEQSRCPRPSLVVIVLPFRKIPPESYEKGVSVTIGKRRRNPVDSLDPAVKSCNLLNNVLAHMEAEDDGAHEAILLNTRGFLAEGTHTNVFFVKDGALKTPSLSCGILSGITREVVLQVARSAGVPVEEGDYLPQDILSADEVFITSTLQEILPVTRLDGRSVGDGRPGVTTRRLLSLLRETIRAGSRSRG